MDLFYLFIPNWVQVAIFVIVSVAGIALLTVAIQHGINIIKERLKK